MPSGSAKPASDQCISATRPAQLSQLGVVTLDTLPGGALGSLEVSDVHEPMPGTAQDHVAPRPGDLEARVGAEHIFWGRGGKDLAGGHHPWHTRRVTSGEAGSRRKMEACRHLRISVSRSAAAPSSPFVVNMTNGSSSARAFKCGRSATKSRAALASSVSPAPGTTQPKVAALTWDQ